MVNICESLINVVSNEQAKDADRLEPKGSVVRDGSSLVACRRHSHRRIGETLTHAGIQTEHGKPVSLPTGKASRKVSRWGCG